jgi:PAS domain S-box-containing protein
MTETPLPEVSEKSLATTLELISDGIWDWDANTGYVYRSPGWYLMLGYEVDAFENNVFTWENVIHPDDYDRVMAHFDSYITGKSPAYIIEYRCRTKSSDYLWIEDRGKIITRNEDGTVHRMIGAHRNINDQKLLELEGASKNAALQEHIDSRTQELIDVNKQLAEKIREAEHLARTDALTSLFNRYQFDKSLKMEYSRATRFQEPLSLVALDVDDFKPINDLHGHPAGDLVLIKLAKLILLNIRDIDSAARWGGDEFMVLLPNTTLDQAFVLQTKSEH